MVEINPRISVIIPAYNIEQYIERCVESILNQSLKDIEVIIVNDGSTDKTKSILESYQNKDKRIRVVNIDNRGVSFSRNLGISMAEGEYITFVDGDDWIDTNMLEAMFNIAKEHNSQVVMCNYVREFKGFSKIKELNMPDKSFYDKEGVYSEIFRKLVGPIGNEMRMPGNLDSLGTAWGKLYKLDHIKKHKLKFVDLEKIGSSEDSLFNISLFSTVENAVFINKPYYHYWKSNPKSITSIYKKDLKTQWPELYKHIRKILDRNNVDKDFYKAMNNRICMNMLGFTLNECSDANEASHIKRVNNIKEIVNLPVMREAFRSFESKQLPIHWRVFYGFSKYRIALPSYLMARIINFLRLKTSVQG